MPENVAEYAPLPRSVTVENVPAPTPAPVVFANVTFVRPGTRFPAASFNVAVRVTALPLRTVVLDVTSVEFEDEIVELGVTVSAAVALDTKGTVDEAVRVRAVPDATPR